MISHKTQSSSVMYRRILNRLGRPFGVNPFPRAFENTLTATKLTPAELFDDIYRKNYWGSNESRSGVGSEREFALRYRKRLDKLLKDRQLRQVFDAPCGDLNWIYDLIQSRQIVYVGGDISSEVIKSAKQQYPNVDLRLFDVTRDAFPRADVWHCRDCLFHLPFAAIYSCLDNFAQSKVQFALITSHRSRVLHRNLDVNYGGFRVLDLEKPPFSLPTPITRIPDYTVGWDFPRYVCLWSREQIAERLPSRKA